ncbi:hypothetical protein LTR36_005495 [Oleoguttula mirabilis]|uniref:Uncharacterized protein n=1 Tax=Oleoguttula mirabilis TaxID=1507867 RepID=A0AAV9JEF3_9PEZI|nr:hypothetical protein LTR36_005495 [Oleoguttula mirabilis]
MPRTLPWATEAAKKQEAKQGASSSSPAPRRKRASTPDDLVDADLNTTGVVTPERRARKRQGRTPSTSPPPGPPDAEYMREGYAADDIWTMVEDEFYSTAQTFTQHIHHAEYVRLKKLAKSRGAGTLQAIARPTDGRTVQSTATKLRLEAEANAKKIKDGLRSMGAHEESDEENDEYMQDPQLAGLMMGSQRGGQELTGLAKVRPKTRAAAGFAKSPQKGRRTRDAEVGAITSDKKAMASKSKGRPVEQDGSERDDDDDDLDAPSTKPLPRRTVSDERQNKAVNSSHPEGTSVIFKRFAESSQQPQSRTSKNVEAGPSRRLATREPQARTVLKVESPPPSSDSGTQAKSARSQATSDFLARRRAAREKREQEEKQTVKRTDVNVPTFDM